MWNTVLSTMPQKYSQSEHRKFTVYSTVLHPTFPSCTARISHWNGWSLYFLWHGIKQLCNARSLFTMKYPTCHCLKAGVNTETIQVTRRIFHEKGCKTGMYNIFDPLHNLCKWPQLSIRTLCDAHRLHFTSFIPHMYVRMMQRFNHWDPFRTINHQHLGEKISTLFS